MQEVIKRVTERDIEPPHEVRCMYFVYCLNLKSGRVEWKKVFHTGHPPGERHRKNSFVSVVVSQVSLMIPPVSLTLPRTRDASESPPCKGEGGPRSSTH
jgi:hypothetical protein